MLVTAERKAELKAQRRLYGVGIIAFVLGFGGGFMVGGSVGIKMVRAALLKASEGLAEAAAEMPK